MSMHAKLNATMISRDTNAYKELLHEDCVFVFHKSGNEFGKTEWISMVEGMMGNEKFVNELHADAKRSVLLWRLLHLHYAHDAN